MVIFYIWDPTGATAEKYFKKEQTDRCGDGQKWTHIDWEPGKDSQFQILLRQISRLSSPMHYAAISGRDILTRVGMEMSCGNR